MVRITGTILLVISAVICFVLSFRHFREKGALLNNAYLYASDNEQAQMDKKPYYRQSAVIFLLVGIMLLILAADMFLMTEWLIICSLIMAAATIVYAVTSSVRINKDRK